MEYDRDRVKIDMPRWTWKAITELLAVTDAHFNLMEHDARYTVLAIHADWIRKKSVTPGELADIEVKEYWSKKKCNPPINN